MPGQIFTTTSGRLGPELVRAHKAAISLLAGMAVDSAGIPRPDADDVRLTSHDAPSMYTVRGHFRNNTALTSYNNLVDSALKEQEAEGVQTFPPTPVAAPLPPVSEMASHVPILERVDQKQVH